MTETQVLPGSVDAGSRRLGYVSSAERAGQYDKWIQPPAKQHRVLVVGQHFVFTGLYAIPAPVLHADPLALEMEMWDAAASDAFWLVESTLDEERADSASNAHHRPMP